MAAPPFVAARVTPEMKTLLRTLAEREQITESALVRQLLEVTLRRSAMEGFPKLHVLEKVSRDARLSVRLRHEDRTLLSARATARGMASATYVSVLVRSHLRNLAPLPKEELLAFRHSITELKAVGRNLNQMAKALNAMIKVAEGLRDHFKAILKANERCWLQGHAETPH